MTAGTAITKTQLDGLAALANSKLPFSYEISGILGDGDEVPFNATQHANGEYINFSPRQNTARAFGFQESSGWRSELLRIRVNVRWLLDGAWYTLGRTRPGSEIMVGGEWPTVIGPTFIGLGNGIVVANQVPYFSEMLFYSPTQNARFYHQATGESAAEISAYNDNAEAISTQRIYRYSVFVPQTTGKNARIYSDDAWGIWLIKHPFFAPVMNPKLSGTLTANADERITRFSAVNHHSMQPYAPLPTPYPPNSPEDATGYYDGLADYNSGDLRDVTGPHSPSRSSYFKIPGYPTRKKDSGEYKPFASEEISRGTYGAVIHQGMIYSVTMSRTTFDASANVTLGNFINGIWEPLRFETLSAGERTKTIYVRWPVMNDAPLYYIGPDDCHVQATFIAKGLQRHPSPFTAYNTGKLNVDVQWPIHSCYHNDTEALLNTL